MFFVIKANIYKSSTVRSISQRVRFEVFMVVTRKNAVFCDVAPCRPSVNRRFGAMYRLLQSLHPPSHAGSSLANFSTLKMEGIRPSETSVHTRTTRRHIPENGILYFTAIFNLVC
jgi:hypothetical protein